MVRVKKKDRKKRSCITRKQSEFKTKLCPFCGGHGSVWGSGVVIVAHVTCDRCGASGPEVYARDGEEEIDCAWRAVAAWNGRTKRGAIE
jgi:transcription elongation factor Elf1